MPPAGDAAPFRHRHRPGSRAGQNAIAIQMTASKIHLRTDMAASFPRWHGTLLPAAGRQRRYVNDVAAPGLSAHHPGITPEGVICGHRDRWAGALAWLVSPARSMGPS